MNPRKAAWLRRKKRVRKKIKGSSEKPRLCVYRSEKHIYAQFIDDEAGKTIFGVSSLSPELKKELRKGYNLEAAKKVGTLAGKKALEKGIKKVVFDRNGYLYYGRVAALAEAARQAGLVF